MYKYLKNKLSDKLKRFGLITTLLIAVKFLVRKIFKISWTSYYVMCRRVSKNDVMPNEFGAEYDIRRFRTEDLYNGTCDNVDPSRKEIFKARLNNPRIEGYGLFLQGKLAYYVWINYEKFEITHATALSLPAKSGLLFDGFCFPFYRKRGAYSFTNKYLINSMIAADVESVYVVVRSYNTPALKTQRRCGLDISQRFTIFKIGSKEYCTLKEVKLPC